MNVQHLFRNELGELRAGWQIGLFLLAFGAMSLVLAAPLLAIAKSREPMLLNVAVLAASLLATWIVTRFVNKKPFTAVGLAVNKQTMRELGLGCLLGWLMLTGIFGVEYVLDHVKVAATELSAGDGLTVFFTAAAFFAVAAMTEEVLFRGYPFQALVRGIGFVPAMAVMGVLFGAAHLKNPNASLFGFINTVLVAFVFCLAYWRTRGLWLPFGIHFAWNFSQTAIYGFPTSGMHFTDFELTRLTQYGPEWLTGGAYGPEGGALAEDAVPRQPRLHALEDQELEDGAVIVQRDAPLGVVVGGGELVARPAAAQAPGAGGEEIGSVGHGAR